MDIWGAWDEPSKVWYKDHDKCVGKVYRYLKKKCTTADYERKIAGDLRTTDAYGYDEKTKTWYICEIKVRWDDVQKGPMQIKDTMVLLKNKNKGDRKHKDDFIVPVLAIPDAFQRRIQKWGNWSGLLSTCNALGVELWLIESGGIRLAKGSKSQKIKVTKSTTKAEKTTKAKTKKTKTTSKIRRTAAGKTKPTKAETTRAKATKAKSIKGATTKSKTRRTKTSKSKK